MSVQVYTSRQRAGDNPARNTIINNIIETYKNTPFNKRNKIFVVTPKQNTYQVERELIEKIGEGGLFGLQIIDPDRLLKNLFDEYHKKVEVVDDHGRLMLMQKTLKEFQNDLGIYRASVKKPSFAEEVLGQISEFKGTQISPEQLLEKTEELDESLLSEKIKDISYIYSKFSQNLGKNRVDEDDIRILALELINKTNFFDDAQIFFLDFSTLSSLEANFISLVDKKAKKTEIAFTTDLDESAPDFSPFAIVNNTIDVLNRTAKNYNTDIKKIPIEFETKGGNSLDQLSTEFFSYSPKSFNHPLINVSLYSQKDPWDEVTRVAQLIALENNRGVKFSDIVVTIPDSEVYENILRRVFSQYKIPIFIDENHQVIDNHFIQSILFALDAVNSNFNRTEILSFIKSEFSGFSKDEIDTIENYVIEAGVKPWEWKETFKRVPVHWKKEERTLEEDHIVNEIRKKLMENIGLLFPKKEKNTFNDYIDRLLAFLISLKSQEKLEELSEVLFEDEQYELSLRYRQIWNILMEIFDQMRSTLGDQVTTMEDFISVLKTGLKSYEIGIIPEDNESVIVARLNRTKLPEVKSLYVLGLNEEILPQASSGVSLFSEREKDHLVKLFNLNESQFRTNQFYHKVEENNLYNFITKASDNVTFSFSSFDNGGDQLLPSRYVNVLESIYGQKVYPEPPKIFPLLNKERANTILEALEEDKSITKYSKSILKEYFGNDEEENVVNNDLNEIKAIDLYQLTAPTAKMSASRLEEFAKCPYQHFIHYGLKPIDREEYEVRALDTGIIIHEVFDKFIRDLNKRSKSIEEYKNIINEYITYPEILEKKVTEIFDQALDNLEDSKRYHLTASSRYLIVKIRRIIFLSLLIMLRQMYTSNFRPDLMEHSFRDQREDNIIIEGRIDRIDIPIDIGDKLPLRIVDYKTGNKELHYSDIYFGQSLQLALYLSEAVKAYNKKTEKEVIPGGSFYFVTDNMTLSNPKSNDLYSEVAENFKMEGIFTKEVSSLSSEIVKASKGKTTTKPKDLSEEELKQVLDYVDSQVENLIKRLVKGDIEISPTADKKEFTACKYCSYRNICQFNEVRDNSKKRDISKSINKKTFFELINSEDV